MTFQFEIPDALFRLLRRDFHQSEVEGGVKFQISDSNARLK